MRVATLPRYLVLVFVLGGACKKDEPIGALQTTTALNGSAIVIAATCTNFASMAAVDQGVFAHCEGGKARLEVPIAKLGQLRTIHVTASNEDGRTMAAADVAVDMTQAGQAPYLRVTGCTAPPSDTKSTHLTVKVGDRTTDCEGSGAGSKLTIEANPHAKLTIAGKTQTVSGTEAVEQTIDLGAGLLGVKLDDVAVDPNAPLKSRVKTTVSVPYSVESEGKTLTGTIELTEVTGSEGGLARSYLTLVAEGKVDRTAFPAKGEPRTIGWITQDDKLRVTDRTGTLRDLDSIGIEHDTRRTENGTCDYKSEDKPIRAKRILVDVEVAVTNLADGKIETKAFPASADPRNCPMFSVMDRKDPKTEARVDDAVIDGWLATLTHR